MSAICDHTPPFRLIFDAANALKRFPTTSSSYNHIDSFPQKRDHEINTTSGLQTHKQLSSDNSNTYMRPLSQLELSANEVFLVEQDTGKPHFFELDKTTMQGLQNVRPKYISLCDYIFGTEISHLMKTSSSSHAEVTEEWKKGCTTVMRQHGLCFDSDGNVLDESAVPDYVNCLEFGAKTLPIRLIQKHLQTWKGKNTNLAKLTVSFQEKMNNKEKMADQLFVGVKHKKVWAQSIHEDSLFYEAELEEYKETLQQKYSLSPDDDHVLIYVALADDGQRMAVLVLSDHAAQLTFGGVEWLEACLHLRDVFREVTETDDYECVSEGELAELIKELKN